jgi:predicted amidophosphoribosyltransferase
MSDPKQPCPRCGYEIGKLLYCTSLILDEYYCPGCKTKIQEKCSKCGTWLTLLERYCQKCGLKNTFFHQVTQKNRN